MEGIDSESQEIGYGRDYGSDSFDGADWMGSLFETIIMIVVLKKTLHE